MNQKHATLFVLPALALLLSGVAGCKLVAAPFLLWGEEPTKAVPAEYPYLTGKKICIVIWADSDTLFTYPWVPLEVAEFVADALKPNIKGMTVVPPRNVFDYQQRDADWDRRPPAEIGAKFGADRVLMIELTQYTTREPGSPHLYRGRISANVKVYDVAHPEAAPTYKAVVESAYPPSSGGTWGTEESAVRAEAMRVFGADTAAKFYDRRVKVR